MKFKVKKIRGGGFTINGKGVKLETIDYRDALFLCNGTCTSLLPFEYNDEKGVEFTYTAEYSTPLSTLMKHPMGPNTLHDILVAFLVLMQECDANNLRVQRVLMERDMIFYDPDDRRVSFIYVPINSYVAPGPGLSATVAEICENAQFASTEDERIAREVATSMRSTAVMTAVAYENLLARQDFLGSLHRGGLTTENAEAIPVIAEKEAHGFDFVLTEMRRIDERHRQEAAKQERQRQAADRTQQQRAVQGAQQVQSGQQARQAYNQQAAAQQECQLQAVEQQAAARYQQQGAAQQPHQHRAAPFSLADAEGNMWPLPVGTSIAGRETDCDIYLDVPGISRHHAQFTWGGSGLKVRDLNSTNGIMVRGRRIDPNVDTPIELGEALWIGGAQFSIVRTNQVR